MTRQLLRQFFFSASVSVNAVPSRCQSSQGVSPEGFGKGCLAPVWTGAWTRSYQSTLLTSERAERSIGRGSPVRAFPYERPNFRLDDAFVDAKVVNDLRTTRSAMAQLTSSHIRCVVLVLLLQYVWVINERLFSRKDSRHPGQTGLEQPDELIEVVQRDFLRLGRHKNCEFIARLECLKRAAILARRDGEVWV